jgi:signal transduction histidine kinase
MPLESGRVEVLEMLQTVLALGRERARSRNLQLALHCPADIGVITADARRLKQAVFNLVSNAIKFTAPGGAVTVEAERRAGELLMTVADTGLGISQSDQTRLFEKFAEGARRSGAGLGLSLVKTLIELHGGKVAIETAPGRGTRILCRLPASPVEHEVLRGWPGADGKIAA